MGLGFSGSFGLGMGCVSCSFQVEGSGTAGLYRPGSRPADSPSSWSKWKGELSLAVGLPSNVTGGYTAGRMADIGSLGSRRS